MGVDITGMVVGWFTRLNWVVISTRVYENELRLFIDWVWSCVGEEG